MIGWALAGLGVASVALGYLAQRRAPSRLFAWLWLLGALAAVHVGLTDATGPVRLLGILVALFFGIKVIVGVEARRAGGDALPLGAWLWFATVWPGMRPAEFQRRGAGDRITWPAALIPIALGAGLLALARTLEPTTIAAFLFVAGFLATLHLGGFALVTILFGRTGYAVRCPFRAPWQSQSLQEFWAKRWNTGFSYLTQTAVYRPVAARFGRGPAVFSGFLFSGLVHEVACSLPVGAGYGLPTLYFVLHGAAVFLEQRFAIRGRLWTLAWVLLPAPLLFHAPLREGVVVPLLG